MKIAETGFETFKLNKQLLQGVELTGYSVPTPVQMMAIPPVFGGQDVVAIAPSGTGKTAAFLLPALMKIRYTQEGNPRVFVLAPTRELVMQITALAKSLAQKTDIRIVGIYGGTGTKPQIQAISEGCDLLVTTPGRFLELYSLGHIILKKISMVVLDEADRLLDMGFREQISRIFDALPQRKQILLFSATTNAKVMSMVDELMPFPNIIETDPTQVTAKNITEKVYFVPNIKTKVNLLWHLMKDEEQFKKVMIFCRSKLTVNNIYKFILRTSKWEEESVKALHGNKDQNTRLKIVKDFFEGNVKVLVATDIAARGLDFSSITHVFNFDVPMMYEDYVHRIGRTGLHFVPGDSITFCTPAEEYHLKKIEKLIGHKIPVSKIPDETLYGETNVEEKKLMDIEIDRQRRKENPDFKGAFHIKKFLQKPGKK